MCPNNVVLSSLEEKNKEKKNKKQKQKMYLPKKSIQNTDSARHCGIPQCLGLEWDFEIKS